ncbi:hypothetical protein [Amycolatopsis sp. YIM 10]|uniref:hypothetical protein n=1 Tax=Amycolatopsis sp. YIM 10 TaxID=2653857 RepID=UPI0012906B34|nr:hypothetical protein [Amycolatopsis sp. YIM 10]
MGNRGGKRSVVVTAALLVVLAIPPTAAWLAWGSGANPDRDVQPIELADPEPRRPGPPPLPLVTPPGDLLIDRASQLSSLVSYQLFSPEELEELVATGVAVAHLRMTRENGVNLLLSRFTSRDDAEPEVTKEALDGIYAAGGHRRVEPAPAGVTVRRFTEAPDAPTVSYHAHYVRGRDVLRIDASGEGGLVGEKIDQAFGALLGEQTKAFPAGEPR